MRLGIWKYLPVELVDLCSANSENKVNEEDVQWGAGNVSILAIHELESPMKSSHIQERVRYVIMVAIGR